MIGSAINSLQTGLLSACITSSSDDDDGDEADGSGIGMVADMYDDVDVDKKNSGPERNNASESKLQSNNILLCI